jgi:hypothetical protein
VKELPVPKEVASAKRSLEFVRGWMIDQELYCSLNVGVWGKKESAFWGLFLSDVAHHIADALNKEKAWDKTKTLRAIQDSFNREIETPSDEFSGEFV